MGNAADLLQPLFDQPIRRVVYLDPGYVSHASDVWLVSTDTEEVVVRASRVTGVLAGPFATGCRRLFGTDPRRIWDLEPLNATLAEISPVPAPRVLRRGWVGERPCVVVERMPGRVLAAFVGASSGVLRDLGLALAHIHRRTYHWCGSPTGRIQVTPHSFGEQVAGAIRALCDEYRPELAPYAEQVCRAASRLPAPAAGALVMADLDPTQFLEQNGRLTAVVDTEYYCVGPRELDFVALEYVLDAKGAALFREAYRSVLPLPAVGRVREVYRLLYLLLEVQGRKPLRDWMSQPALFD